jgi:hypothetical protein
MELNKNFKMISEKIYLSANTRSNKKESYFKREIVE